MKNNIKKIMRKNQIKSIYKLSKISGIPRNTLRRWVVGECYPTLLMAYQLAMFLNCDVADIFILEEQDIDYFQRLIKDNE